MVLTRADRGFLSVALVRRRQPHPTGLDPGPTGPNLAQPAVFRFFRIAPPVICGRGRESGTAPASWQGRNFAPSPPPVGPDLVGGLRPVFPRDGASESPFASREFTDFDEQPNGRP
jgi:hypothetical protein